MSEQEETSGGSTAARVDLARGLVAGWMNDQVQGRGILGVRIGVGTALVGLIILIFAGGWWRLLGGISMVVGIVVFGTVWLVKRAASYAIRRFAEPKSLDGQTAALDAAVSEIDLPQGPLSIIRFLGRIRKGPGPELDRVTGILADLERRVVDGE